jgi:chemotaxis signal transduction protein
VSKNRLDIVRYQEDIHDLLQNSAKQGSDEKTAPLLIQSGDEFLSLDADNVSHIDFFTEVTPIPGSEDWMLGVCQTKGRVVVVVDFAAYQGAPKVRNGKLVVFKKHDIALLANIDSESQTAAHEFPLAQLLERVNSNNDMRTAPTQ